RQGPRGAAGGGRPRREAVSEGREPVAVSEAAVGGSRSLGEGEDGGPRAQQADAGGGGAVDRADPPRTGAEERNPHQPVIGHPVDEPRRIRIEETGGHD